MRIQPVFFAVLVSIATALSSTSVVLAARVGVQSPRDPSTLDASPRRIAIDVSITDGHQIATLDSFRAAIGGRAPATWTIWSDWGDPAKRDFPTRRGVACAGAGCDAADLVAAGRPERPREPALRPPRQPHRRPTRRLHPQFRAGGQGLRQPRHPPLRPRGERQPLPLGRQGLRQHGGVVRGGLATRPPTLPGGRRDERQVPLECRQEGLPGRLQPVHSVLPGRRVRRLHGLQQLQLGSPTREWVADGQGVQDGHEPASQISPKPIIAAENASNAQGGDKAAWIREGYRAVYAELPRISAIIYLDVDLRPIGHPDWRLGSPAAALAAYARDRRPARVPGPTAGHLSPGPARPPRAGLPPGRCASLDAVDGAAGATLSAAGTAGVTLPPLLRPCRASAQVPERVSGVAHA